MYLNIDLDKEYDVKSIWLYKPEDSTVVYTQRTSIKGMELLERITEQQKVIYRAQKYLDILIAHINNQQDKSNGS